MREFAIISLISVLILVSGCLETQRDVVNVYVCADGSQASNARDCPKVEPEVMEITRYVCFDGEVVDNVADCPTTTVKVTSTIATTSLMDAPETTTLEELGTTTAEETTSTVEEEAQSTVEEETTSTVEGTSTIEDDYQFVGSVNSDKYHYPDCRYATRINKENLISFADEDEAQEEGYSPCGVCDPPT